LVASANVEVGDHVDLTTKRVKEEGGIKVEEQKEKQKEKPVIPVTVMNSLMMEEAEESDE